MSIDNFSFSGDLEQIVRNQMSSVELLEELKARRPDLADDFSAMQKSAAANIADLEAMAEREKRDAEKFSE